MPSGAGKIVRLRQKLVDLADSVKGLFGAKKQQDNAVERLERLKVRSHCIRSVCCRLGICAPFLVGSQQHWIGSSNQLGILMEHAELSCPHAAS